MRFDDEILKEQERLKENRQSFISFQWDTGFVVMAQSEFNKLSRPKKKILMKHMIEPMLIAE